MGVAGADAVRINVGGAGLVIVIIHKTTGKFCGGHEFCHFSDVFYVNCTVSFVENERIQCVA